MVKEVPPLNSTDKSLFATEKLCIVLKLVLSKLVVKSLPWAKLLMSKAQAITHIKVEDITCFLPGIIASRAIQQLKQSS